MSKVSELAKTWLLLKEQERVATESRREIEDVIMKTLNVSESLDGTENFTIDNAVKIKIVGRMNRKIDTDKLQQLAAENGLSEHLTSLFRWKAEINSTAWKASNDAITKPLMEAITTAPGRPSFSITEELT